MRPFPDMEKLAYERLRDLGGIQVFAIDAQTPSPHVTDTVTLQVDVRASSKQRARDRAYQVRQILIDLPVDVTAQVARVNVVGGPSWLPDADGAPRYVLRIALTTRVPRDIG